MLPFSFTIKILGLRKAVRIPYQAAAVSRMWWPQRFHNGRAIFLAGSDTIPIDAGINVMHEFAPDRKRWLHGDFGRHR